MNPIPLTDLWTTFSPEMRHQLTFLWTDLLHRQLQAQRLPPAQGAAYESLPQDPHPPLEPPSSRIRPAIDH